MKVRGVDRIRARSVLSLWVIHLLSLLIVFVWAATDPLFESLLVLVRSSPFTSAFPFGWLRIAAFTIVAFAAMVSLIILIAKALGSSNANAKQRSLRSLLCITTIIAVWCSLSIHLEAIAWQGKRVRFAFHVDELDAIVAPLRADWPQRDGELSTIGPFMAYPFGQPSTLLLLQSPQVASESVHVSAIERGCNGAIKLQLTGSDGGVWAEWHPPQSHPESFIGGLSDSHQLRAATSIGRGWYLVEYAA